MNRFLKICLLGVAGTAMFSCAVSHAQETTFDFAQLRANAQTLAGKPYVPATPLPANLAALDYDKYRKILFNTRNEIWKKLPFALQFMHMGYFYHEGVVIHEIDGGALKPVPFSKKYYLYTGTLSADAVDESALSFAGFRILHESKSADYEEIISFLGASYFRAVGLGQSFGLSSRGLAVNAIPAGAEEFPAFREFWIERPKTGSKQVKIYALLDGESVTGAYEFTVAPGDETLVHVKATVFARRKVESVGIAPLTSMFWYSALNAQQPISKGRPAVHDSDGLLVRRRADEWTWHPLSNPSSAQQSEFEGENVRGFGLLQRDRSAGDYQDKEAKYESRPGVWVEPIGDWGKGSVRLLELPTHDEYTDNVVATWTPAEPLEAGKSIDFEYNLHWSAKDPAPAAVLHVTSTRVIVEKETHRLQFIVNFSASKRVSLFSNDMNVNLKTGDEGIKTTDPVLAKTPGGWSVAFSAELPSQPVEFTCALHNGKKAISEKWHYNYQP